MRSFLESRCIHTQIQKAIGTIPLGLFYLSTFTKTHQMQSNGETICTIDHRFLLVIFLRKRLCTVCVCRLQNNILLNYSPTSAIPCNSLANCTWGGASCRGGKASWFLGSWGRSPPAEPPPQAPFRETRTLGVSGQLMRQAPARLFAS